jgi:small ligand-binding sensory domain FIST
MALDQLNSDFLLHIIGFLNVQESNKLAATSQRYYYLVHHYRRLRGPELVASTSHIPGVSTRRRTVTELLQHAVDQIQAPPNLVLAFNTQSSTLAESLPVSVPDDTVILGVVASQIQTGCQGHLDYKSKAAVMLGSLSGNAVVKPLCFTAENSNNFDEQAFEDYYEQLAATGDDWKVFMVYACDVGSDYVEPFIHGLQARYPDATIVGGICYEGYVSVPVEQKTREELTQILSVNLLRLNKCLGGPPPAEGLAKKELVEHVYKVMQSKTYRLEMLDNGGICGVALGGQDVPVRSMVSRGVKSLTRVGGFAASGDTRPSTNFTVEQAEYILPTDEGYMFTGVDPPPYHLIRRIRDNDTGKVYSPVELVTAFGQSTFLGVRRVGEDGFSLHMPHPISLNLNAFLLVKNENSTTEEAEQSLENANVDLLDLDGKACMNDMTNATRKLKEQTQGEKLLGAVMISCNGRGPTAGGLISEDMSDATRFAKAFPDVPCLGFYAGGEIGPEAKAGRESAFQAGRTALQGFTAVFALFIVPIIDLSGVDLDDCSENVEQFVASRFGAKAEAAMEC